MIISKQQKEKGVITMGHYPDGNSRKSTHTHNDKQEV